MEQGMCVEGENGEEGGFCNKDSFLSRLQKTNSSKSTKRLDFSRNLRYSLFSIPTPGSQPVGITSGPCGDGTQCLWFTESYSNKIGKITTSGQITEYPLPPTPAQGSAEPEGITSGPCGDGTQCLWITEFSQTYGNNIGKITPDGQITLYPIPTAKSEPESITSGSDGNLWFTEYY